MTNGRVTLAITPEAERFRGYFMLPGSAFLQRCDMKNDENGLKKGEFLI